MMYLATITLAISFVAQFMINVEADRLSALKSIVKKQFHKRNKRPECPPYNACTIFVDAMQHRHKHVTLGKFPNNIMLFGKNVCPAGSTSANIQCGMTYTESVTLTEDLFCDGSFSATNTFITMDGADAILDCNGYKIFGSTVTPLGTAVLLTGGASAINCPIGNVDRGIDIRGVGCSTVMNVDIAFTDDDAIRVRNSGTTVLDSIVIDSSNQNGIEVAANGLVIMSDITISGVGQDGICLLSSAPRVQLYGDIFIEKAGKDGIAFDSSLSGNYQVTAYCSLTLFDNGAGISFDKSGSFTFESESITMSCFNTGSDIVGTLGGFFRVGGANVQCDKVAPAGSFNCDEDCVILPSSSTVGETPGCLANEDP